MKEGPAAAGLKNTVVIEKAKRAKFIMLDKNNLMAEVIKSESMEDVF